jgi:hypothetical protein
MPIDTFAAVVTGGKSKGREKGTGVGVGAALAKLRLMPPSIPASASARKILGEVFTDFSKTLGAF